MVAVNGFLPLRHELIVDNFAGGGGASTGIEAAFGRPVDIAVNHDGEAIAIGNSVCPPVAEALVKANFKHEAMYEAVNA